jgi:hypothetical protein
MSRLKQRVLISLLLPGALVTSGCLRKSKVEAAAAAQKKEERAGAEKAGPYKFGVSRVLTLPAGTRFSVFVPAKSSTATVEGELAAPISAFTETVVPRGAKVVTQVSQALAASKGEAQISMRATQIRLKNGEVVNISSDEAKVIADPGEKLVSFRLANPVQVKVER